MRKLGAWAGGVTVGTIVYHRVSENVSERTDNLFLGSIAVAAAACVAVQLSFTFKWRSLGLGLLSIFAGLMFLYARILARGLGIDAGEERIIISLTRVLLLAGVMLTINGLRIWVTHHRDKAFPYWRRNLIPGGDPFTSPGSDKEIEASDGGR